MKQYVSKLTIKVVPNNRLAFNGSTNLIKYSEEFAGELNDSKRSIKSSLENIGCQFSVFNSDFNMLMELLHFIQSSIRKIGGISDKSIIKHKGIFNFAFGYKGVVLNIHLTIHKF